MATTYLNINPPEPDPDSIDAFYNQTFLSRGRRLSPLEREFRYEDEQFAAEQGLTPDQRVVSRAARRFQHTFDVAWNKYGSQTLQDGVDGFYDFSVALDNHLDKELTGVSGVARNMLQPVLSQMRQQAIRIGLKHWGEQNEAVRQQIELAKAERAKADSDSADALLRDLNEAQRWHDNPLRLGGIVQRGEAQLRALGQRQGWDESRIAEQLKDWGGRVYGVAIAAHLDKGDVAGARALLLHARQQLDPAQADKLEAAIIAGERYIADRANTPTDANTTQSGSQVAIAGAEGPPQDVALTDRHGRPDELAPPKPVLRDHWKNPAPGPGYELKWHGNRAIWVYKPRGGAPGEGPAGDLYEADTWRYLGAEAGRGYHTSYVGQAVDQITLPPLATERLKDGGQKQRIYRALIDTERGPGHIGDYWWPTDVQQDFAKYLAQLPEDRRKAKQAEIERALREMGVEFLTEEEWNNDPELKRDIPFEPFMTRERALAKAQLYDDMREREYQIGHAPNDPFIRAAGKVLGFVSDPTNVVPAAMGVRQLFNVAKALPGLVKAIGSGEALNVAKTEGAKILIGGVKTGLATGGKTALEDTLTKPWRESMGEEVPWSQIGLNAAQAAGMAMLFGIAGGVGGRVAHAPAGGGGGGGSAAVPPKPPTSSTSPTSSGTGSAPSRWSPRLGEKQSVIVDPNGNGSFYSPPVKGESGGIILHPNGTKSFWSKDPGVAHTAYNIESQLPGKLKRINQDFYDPSGKKLTDADLLFDNVVVEVKSGRNYDKWVDQLPAIQRATGRPVIIFAPDLKKSYYDAITAKGYKVFRNEQDLIDEIARLHP